MRYYEYRLDMTTMQQLSEMYYCDGLLHEKDSDKEQSIQS